MNDSGGSPLTGSGGSGRASKSSSASNNIPAVFQTPKDPIADLQVSVLDGKIVKVPKGIDPKIKCTVVVEGAAGDTEALHPSRLDWKTEFKFPLSETEVGVEVALASTHVDLVTQEQRSAREGVATLKYTEADLKDGKEKSLNIECKKGGKGKPTGSVNLTLRYILRAQPFSGLEKLLLESNEFTKVVFECAKSIETPNEFAKGLLFIYWCHGQEQKLLKLCIEYEISILAKAGDDTTQLLRGSTISMYILSEYMKTICENYLRELLQPLVKPLAQGGQRFEVDPGKLAMSNSGEDIEKLRKRNQKNLLELVSKFLKKILASYASLPPDMGELCRMLKSAVDERYQDGSAWTQAAGALVFLRFICPAIAAPESAGLVQGDIGVEGRRCLVLVTKVLQNLVNNVDFGDKEDYMTCMNPFIDKYRSKPAEFYQQLLKKKNGKLLEDRVVMRRVPENYLVQTAKVILGVNVKSESKIIEGLSEEKAVLYRELVPQLTETIARIEREAAQKAVGTSTPKKKRSTDSTRSARPKTTGAVSQPGSLTNSRNSSPNTSSADLTPIVESTGVRSPRVGSASPVSRMKDKRGHHPRRNSTSDADHSSVIQHSAPASMQSTVTINTPPSANNTPPSPLTKSEASNLRQSKLKSKITHHCKKNAMSSSAPLTLRGSMGEGTDFDDDDVFGGAEADAEVDDDDDDDDDAVVVLDPIDEHHSLDRLSVSMPTQQSALVSS
eukprot:TRINITY_DN7891_c0_g1_i3.p1 TRINITY_DN7891_c0_g1~~TRINITY_DN7891_c0_g1_i3.p1  ORF type:complete len:727 (+),score=115.35 TRINITY_DN7891_c0_g1_i3:335-2515(+)